MAPSRIPDPPAARPARARRRPLPTVRTVAVAALCCGLLAACDTAAAQTTTHRPTSPPTATSTSARPTPGAGDGRGGRPGTGQAGGGDQQGGEHGDQHGHRRPGRTPQPTPAPQPGTPNAHCTLVVPPAPLTAAGLATPYRLTATDQRAGACHETNDAQSAFVEATILDPVTGALSVYRPLVVDDGTTPAAPPVTPTLPQGAIVGVWFGFQGDTLTLRGGTGCVNGLPGSPFGQFAYCGAPAFFAAAHAAQKAGRLTVPPLGTGSDGKPCPTTRDFSVVDQDQSDNLTTVYVGLPDGRTAPDTAATEALPGATRLLNASDNGLLDRKIAPALGCTPFTAPDLSAGGAPGTSLALNELQAAAQGAPVALIPPNDPMALVNGKQSIAKTNLYRLGAGMPPVNQATDTAAAYCSNIATVAPARLALDKQFTEPVSSPDPAAANLFDFLVQRLDGSWTELGCAGAAPTVP